MSVARDMTGPRLELFSMLAQAAQHEMGVALIPPFLIQRELQDGSLVVALDRAVPHNDRAYYLMVPERKAESTALKAFRDWLLQQAAAYRSE
jgi:DNA-binding transcriptional LysR family regulator